MPVMKSPQKPKADKDKQFDVIIQVAHDDRTGNTRTVEKPARYSFETEAEALDLARQLKAIAAVEEAE